MIIDVHRHMVAVGTVQGDYIRGASKSFGMMYRKAHNVDISDREFIDTIVRPLIEISREDIVSYLEQKGMQYVTDPSNFETRFLRNNIRLNLLPQLKKIQPRIIELLGQTAEIMTRDNSRLETESEEWMERNAEIRADQEIRLPLSSFMMLPEALRYRVIRRALKLAGGTLRRISLKHIEAISCLTKSSKPQPRVNLPNGLLVKRVYDKLVFKKGKGRIFSPFLHALDGPGTFYLKDLGYAISLEEIEEGKQTELKAPAHIAFLNADHLIYPLHVRNFRPGDRFIPLGMSGHKKLKDFFIELKIPAEDRPRIPILTHNDRIVWVCGLRIDDRYKVTSNTKKVLKVSFTGNFSAT